MKIFLITLVLATLGCVVGSSSHHFARGDEQFRKEAMNRICNADEYPIKDTCLKSGQLCVDALREKKTKIRPRPNPAIRNAVSECLNDYPELNIPNPFENNDGPGKGIHELEIFLNKLEDQTVAATIRCCVGKATNRFTEKGLLDKEYIRKKLKSQISDTATLAAFLSGVESCPEPVDCETTKFRECNLKACIDAKMAK